MDLTHLYRCENGSFLLNEKYNIRVQEKVMIREQFEPKKEKQESVKST